jgi:hypothetical protein
MSDEVVKKLNFVENELPKLMSNQKVLEGLEVVECHAEAKVQLDGFMSSIFTVRLVVEDADGK